MGGLSLMRLIFLLDWYSWTQLGNRWIHQLVCARASEGFECWEAQEKRGP